jgi:allophanate hydrolase
MITRVGPATTIQDAGRFGMLRHGISASGPMDGGAFRRAGVLLGRAGGEGIEFSAAGLAFTLEDGKTAAAFAGGSFLLKINGAAADWPARADLKAGDRVEITPGADGNYGYVRFDQGIDVPLVLGSRSTNLVAGLGGLDNRALQAGDLLMLRDLESEAGIETAPAAESDGPIRVIWGLHADLFAPAVRQFFLETPFRVSRRLDRMGVRLDDPAGVFAGMAALSLVSDAVVAGDIQVLGDGTPIVLMRDHQPTGGYPRIATVISADLDRLAQLRPGTELAFCPVTLHKARELLLAAERP